MKALIGRPIQSFQDESRRGSCCFKKSEKHGITFPTMQRLSHPCRKSHGIRRRHLGKPIELKNGIIAASPRRSNFHIKRSQVRGQEISFAVIRFSISIGRFQLFMTLKQLKKLCPKNLIPILSVRASGGKVASYFYRCTYP